MNNGTLDIDEILSHVDNISSDSVLETGYKEYENKNREVIKTIGLDNNKCEALLSSLHGYKLIESIDELEYGRFSRVIKLNNINHIDDIKIKKVGFVVNCFDAYSKAHKRKRIMIKCKLGHVFNNVVFEECFFFQKIRDDDMLVMSLVDYLRENK